MKLISLHSVIFKALRFHSSLFQSLWYWPNGKGINRKGKGRMPIWFWGKNYWGRIYSLRICMGIKVCFKENEFFEISWGKKFWGKNLHGSQFPVQKFRRRLCRGRIYSEPMKPCWQGGSTILYKNIKLYTSSHRSKNYLHICWDFIYCFFCYIIPGNGQFGQWTKLFFLSSNFHWHFPCFSSNLGRQRLQCVVE